MNEKILSSDDLGEEMRRYARGEADACDGVLRVLEHDRAQRQEIEGKDRKIVELRQEIAVLRELLRRLRESRVCSCSACEARIGRIDAKLAEPTL